MNDSIWWGGGDLQGVLLDGSFHVLKHDFDPMHPSSLLPRCAMTTSSDLSGPQIDVLVFGGLFFLCLLNLWLRDVFHVPPKRVYVRAS